jgi:hypothetical protein
VDRVLHLACLSLISQARGQRGTQPQLAIRSVQQDGSSIRAALPLVELRHHQLFQKSGKQYTLCRDILWQVEASLCIKPRR